VGAAIPASFRARRARRRTPGGAGPGRWAAGVGAGVLAVLAVVVGLSVLQHPGGRPAAQLPYPLDIPVGQRTPAQLVQSRLMLPVALLESRQLLALPPGTNTARMTPSVELALRIATSAPTLDWSTAASWGPTVLAVYSPQRGTRAFQLAGLAGHTCWMLQFDYPHVRYGWSQLAAGQQCLAAAQPLSGWRPHWPAEGGRR